MREEFAALRDLPREPDDDPVIIELVFAEDLTPDTVADRVREAVPDAEVTVESAFGQPTDRFHFATFPNLRARGQEPEVFAFARALRPGVGAADANPVLTDSLYGAVAIGAAATTVSAPGCPVGFGTAGRGVRDG